MGHRLFAVDVLSRTHGVDHHLAMPMIGDSGDNAVDVLVVEKLAIAPRHRQIGSDNLAREGVSAVVKVGSGGTFHSRNCDRGAEQPRALHADANHSKSNSIAWRNCPPLMWRGARTEEHGARRN